MSDVLLDTDTVSYFLKGIPSVSQELEAHIIKGNGLQLSVIT